nr:MAG TPA: hypothetical protein [Caudoviricetes sp.]
MVMIGRLDDDRRRPTLFYSIFVIFYILFCYIARRSDDGSTTIYRYLL